MGEGGGKREGERGEVQGVREERDREYREQRKGRGVEDKGKEKKKGQWMYDTCTCRENGEVHVERMMGRKRAG